MLRRRKISGFGFLLRRDLPPNCVGRGEPVLRPDLVRSNRTCIRPKNNHFLSSHRCCAWPRSRAL